MELLVPAPPHTGCWCKSCLWARKWRVFRRKASFLAGVFTNQERGRFVEREEASLVLLTAIYDRELYNVLPGRDCPDPGDDNHKYIQFYADGVLLNNLSRYWYGRKQEVNYLPLSGGYIDSDVPYLGAPGAETGPGQKPLYTHQDGSEVTESEWRRVERRVCENELYAIPRNIFGYSPKNVGRGYKDDSRDDDPLLPGELHMIPGCPCFPPGKKPHRHINTVPLWLQI